MFSRNRSTLKETNSRQFPENNSLSSSSLTSKIARNTSGVVQKSVSTSSASTSTKRPPFSESLVLQAQIRDAKIWGRYKCEKLDILFDLHAVIDSEFGVNDFDGVTFTLRDATDSLDVTYYEIDVEMPDVKRGDWVRVGCTNRPWGFQATSVQKASAGFLTGFYEKLIGSRMALEKKVSELNLKSV